ncbi:SCO7613 C-terminal domain-containing membrane protein [Streptomyces sp. NBC_00728]|uniref:SCO7613 C-terminal domain-containing membrane protein n=1 Tax=Streptomyces sp. NBC_00728 TaxID=2903676 RepID=UPI00386D0F12
MSQIPSPAEELLLLDTELRQLDARRAVLLTRRAWLVRVLQPPPVRTTPLAPPASPALRPEATAPGVQNTLLLLGGVLLTVAAVAFTLVGWGQLGIAGRSLVLGAVTLAALGAPALLLRRGLRSTAEALAGLGLALTVLDAYALYAVALPSTDGVGYAAVASAVLAAVWAAYGHALGARRRKPEPRPASAAAPAAPDTSAAPGLPGASGAPGTSAARSASSTPGSSEPSAEGAGEYRAGSGTGPREAAPGSGPALGVSAGTGTRTGAGRRGVAAAAGPSLRLPLPAAVVAAQLPLLLWAVAAAAGAHGVTAALLVTAALDTALALRTPHRSLRVVAAAGAYGLGGWGTFAAGWLSWTAAGPSAAARAAALLLLAASIATAAAWGTPKPGVATGTATAGGLITVVAFGGVLRTAVPGEWSVPGHLACGLALLAVARTGLPEPVRRGFALASGCVGALAVAWALPVVVITVLGPVGRAGSVWSGAPANARDAVTSGPPWPSDAATAPLVLGLVAAALVVAVRAATWRPHALACALTLTWATVFVLPATLELPYAAGLSVHGITVMGLLWSARRAHPSVTAPVLALLTSLSLAFLALASEAATLTVLGVLAVLFATAATRPGLGPVTAPASLGYAAALACATGASLGLRPQHTALLVLVVAVVAALLAAHVDDGPTTVSIEVTGALAGLLATGLAVAEPAMLATVLALCGVIAAGTAVREDRRAVGYAAVALFVLAAWVRLAAWGVAFPEAYTLPVTVPALLVGAFRRRRDTAVSSWTVYAPGLAMTLVPSLFAAWGDAQWQRPLLLGAAALAVTLLGARNRLQAPLVLGGSVLVLDALHELAPYIVQVVDALPRWAPPALAGLLLLALGATYEQRIRDARRVREVLGRMD